MNDVDHTKANLQEWECKCLLAEYNSLREDMRMCAQFHRRDTHLLVIVIGAVLAFCHSKQDPVTIGSIASSPAAYIVPSLIFVFFLLQIISFHWENVMVRQCARIERRVTDLYRKNLMDYESVVARRYIRKFTAPTMVSAIALMAFFIVLFIFFSVSAHKITVETHKSNIRNLFDIMHSIEFFIMIATSAKTAYYEFTETMPDVVSEHAQSIIKNGETRKN